MKSGYFTIVLALICTSFTLPHWQNNFEEAKKNASAEHKCILLNFSGSDWCGPCIKMHKEIFGSEVFTTYADEKLVLVNADFPRLKKNQLQPAQQKQNDALADRYNSIGAFPFTLLLSPEGKIMKVWDGYPKGDAATFTNEVKTAISGTY